MAPTPIGKASFGCRWSLAPCRCIQPPRGSARGVVVQDGRRRECWPKTRDGHPGELSHGITGSDIETCVGPNPSIDNESSPPVCELPDDALDPGAMDGPAGSISKVE